LGHVIEHHVIQGAITEKLSTLSNISFVLADGDLKIDFQNEETDRVTISTKDQQLHTRLIVGADGANSTVRSAANIQSSGFKYNQTGIVATVKVAAPNNTAYQRFLPTGPVALLPLYDNYSSVVWSTNPYQAKALKSMPDSQFLEALEMAFNSPTQVPSSAFVEIGTYVQNSLFDKKNRPQDRKIPEILQVVGPRGAFPLQALHAHDYVKPRLALVGDACHVVHPLAGQGINLGFSDVVVLTNSILKAISTGTDIGNMHTLNEYQTARRLSNLPIMAGIDFIGRFFGSSAVPLIIARNIGLQIVEAVSPIKNFFIQNAEGANLDLSLIGENR